MTAPRRSAVEWIALAVAAVTILSAAFQIVAPDRALGTMGIAPTPELALFLTLASLLTATFGAAMLHTVWTRRLDRAVVFWAGVAKLWGPAVLALGVARGLVGSTALLVAAYDLAAGVFTLWYASTLVRSAAAAGERGGVGQPALR